MIVEGVTVTALSDNGGAIRVYDGGVLISRGTTYSNCISENNGGAIYNSGYLNLTNVIFENCIAKLGDGGAIYNTQNGEIISSTMSISTCSGLNGGGICNNGTGILNLEDSIFTSNNATQGGGGDISINGIGSKVSILKSIFKLSYSNLYGGSIGIFNSESSTVNIENTMFSLTSSNLYGGVLASLEDSKITFKGYYYVCFIFVKYIYKINEYECVLILFIYL